MMDLTKQPAFDGQCGHCSTEHACGAYRQCLQKPLAKAHPAAVLIGGKSIGDTVSMHIHERDERLERVKELTGAESAGFLPEDTKPAFGCVHKSCPTPSECSITGRCASLGGRR